MRDKLKNDFEEKLKETTSSLTKGQRCEDWFILRQLRVTGTVAGIVLLCDSTILSMVRHGSCTTVARTQGEAMHIFGASMVLIIKINGANDERDIK